MTTTNTSQRALGSRLRRGLMYQSLILTTACAATPNDSAICDGTALARSSAASGALLDGGPVARRSLNELLDQIEAGCG